jgi:serine/threonine protein phosphatase PrpC
MINCLRCSFENPESNRFCQNCGVNLAEIISPLDSQDVLDELINEAIALETASDNEPVAENIPPQVTETFTEPFIEDELITEPLPQASAKAIIESLTETDAEPITEPQLDFLTEPKNPDPLAPNLTEDFQDDLTQDLPNVSPETKELSTSDLMLLDTILTEFPQPLAPIKMRLKAIAHAGQTDVGKLRDHNEDNFMICHQVMTSAGKDCTIEPSYRSLFVLCDGMGGHAGGEVASAMAIATITEQFTPFWGEQLPGEQKLKDIVLEANQKIYDHNEQELRSELGRMGTTLVIMVVHNTEVAIAHVGDSRIYKVTNPAADQPKLEQITRDHEVANRLIDQGVDAKIANARFDAHQLTQAIGPNPSLQLSPSIRFLSISEPTLFLLCSDGLCDNDVVEQNWQTHLLPFLSPESDLQSGLKDLIALGNELNGHDNITAILINCQVEAISS